MLPYYPMYAEQFNGSERVRLMSLEATGLYILCLNHAWGNDGLPVEIDQIMSAMGLGDAKARKARKAWLEVEPLFPVVGDRRRNGVQEEYRDAAVGRSKDSADRVRKYRERHLKRVTEDPMKRVTEDPMKRVGNAFGNATETPLRNAFVTHIRASDSDYDYESESSESGSSKEISLREIRDVQPQVSAEAASPRGTSELFDAEQWWVKLWELDPYGSGEGFAKAVFLEIIASSVHPERIAPAIFESRKRWNEHCSKIHSKPLGTKKFLESGDYLRKPPKSQANESSDPYRPSGGDK